VTAEARCFRDWIVGEAKTARDTIGVGTRLKARRELTS
jgi:hypothetical protein